jgi:hypothetical protein
VVFLFLPLTTIAAIGLLSSTKAVELFSKEGALALFFIPFLLSDPTKKHLSLTRRSAI